MASVSGSPSISASSQLRTAGNGQANARGSPTDRSPPTCASMADRKASAASRDGSAPNSLRAVCWRGASAQPPAGGWAPGRHRRTGSGACVVAGVGSWRLRLLPGGGRSALLAGLPLAPRQVGAAADGVGSEVWGGGDGRRLARSCDSSISWLHGKRSSSTAASSLWCVAACGSRRRQTPRSTMVVSHATMTVMPRPPSSQHNPRPAHCCRVTVRKQQSGEMRHKIQITLTRRLAARPRRAAWPPLFV